MSESTSPEAQAHLSAAETIRQLQARVTEQAQTIKALRIKEAYLAGVALDWRGRLDDETPGRGPMMSVDVHSASLALGYLIQLCEGTEPDVRHSNWRDDRLAAADIASALHHRERGADALSLDVRSVKRGYAVLRYFLAHELVGDTLVVELHAHELGRILWEAGAIADPPPPLTPAVPADPKEAS